MSPVRELLRVWEKPISQLSHQQARKPSYFRTNSLSHCIRVAPEVITPSTRPCAFSHAHACKKALGQTDTGAFTIVPWSSRWPSTWAKRLWLGQHQHLPKVERRYWGQMTNSPYPLTAGHRAGCFYRASIFLPLMEMAEDSYHMTHPGPWCTCPGSLSGCRLDFRASSKQDRHAKLHNLTLCPWYVLLGIWPIASCPFGQG